MGHMKIEHSPPDSVFAVAPMADAVGMSSGGGGEPGLGSGRPAIVKKIMRVKRPGSAGRRP